MNQDSRNKIKAIGMTIVRSDDYPSPRIKEYIGNGNWKTFAKFDTKADRDLKMKEILTYQTVIEE